MWRATFAGWFVLIAVCASFGAGPTKKPGSKPPPKLPSKPTPYPKNALPGLTPDQVQAFLAAQNTFNEVETAADGLGPIFNDTSCAVCHPNGGGSTRISNIIGLAGPAQLADGGPVIQLKALPGFMAEVVPTDVTVGKRRAMTAMGLGLIGGIPDQNLLNLQTHQANNAPLLAGKANIVMDAVTGLQHVGRVGQKSQHPNSTSFAAEAYLREMGVTTPFFPVEEAPYNNVALLAGNPFPGINNDGGDVLAFGFFMDHLKPPSGQSVTKNQMANVQAGAAIFDSIGCSICHHPRWTTGTSDDHSLSEITFAPFSDFLLHDMGASGDQIQQGTDSNGQPIPGSWMRTTPLWGVSTQTKLWHDASLDSIPAAINNHAGQGLPAKMMFQNLTTIQKQQLLAFLNSL